MAKVRTRGKPQPAIGWPLGSFPNASNPSMAGPTNAMDSSADLYSITDCIVWEDGGTHDIRYVHWRCQVAGGSPNYTVEIGLADPTNASGPPARWDGTLDQSGTQANPTAATNYTTTLGTDRTGVADGTLLCLVFQFSAYVQGTFGPAAMSTSASSRNDLGLSFVHFDGVSTYSLLGNAPLITFESPDGYFGHFAQGLPRLSALTSQNFNNSGTRRVALEFVADAKEWAHLIAFFVTVASGADFDLVLYEGTSTSAPTEKVRLAVDSTQIHSNGAARWIEKMVTEQQLTDGETYRLALEPSTANNVSVYYIDVSTAAHKNSLAPGCSWVTHDGTNWSSPTTTRVPLSYYGRSAIEDGAGGGGGLLRHPGMAGGMAA